MKPGQLDQRVTLQSKTRTADNMGGATETWSDVGTFWAMVRPMRGRETLDDQRVEAKGMYRFVMRERDVNETQRFLWKGEAYNIRAVMREGGRSLYLDIDAERGVGV